jgi:hypothetical protein
MFVMAFVLAIKQNLLVPIQQKTEGQLMLLTQEYNKILEKLKKEYEGYHKLLSAKKIHCNK